MTTLILAYIGICLCITLLANSVKKLKTTQWWTTGETIFNMVACFVPILNIIWFMTCVYILIENSSLFETLAEEIE